MSTKKDSSKGITSNGSRGQNAFCELLFTAILALPMIFFIGFLLTGSITWSKPISTQIPFSNPKTTKDVLHLTPEELAKFDGSDPSKPIYLAIKGKIFDVTAGADKYGPKGGYHGFAGRDASRSFINLCFTPECLATADNLEGLSESDKKTIDDWEAFYMKEAKYPLVGYVKKPEVEPPASKL